MLLITVAESLLRKFKSEHHGSGVEQERRMTDAAMLYDAVKLFALSLIEWNGGKDAAFPALDCREDKVADDNNTDELIAVMKKIGTWSPSAGLNITEDEDEDDGEEDEVLRVLSVPVSPFMIVKEVDGKAVYSGFCVDLLDKLSAELDFKYELHVLADDARGRPNDTGHWDGMIGEVIAGKADLALADLTITEMRERVIDFTLPYMTAGLVAVTKKGQPRSPGGIWSFFLPLTREASGGPLRLT
ncbi:hypothetical protein HPB52_015796 [Rhipicephalus sanguineus]|uniref:Uncharacterized protein n=1 Tax=Rhipicephalus sanguineus TaxID=34632 RepID=A0A9D4PNL4_RHISA|nr:hypothetical protein HPB52_015796 [Rhipicephalus sanguineus]